MLASPNRRCLDRGLLALRCALLCGIASPALAPPPGSLPAALQKAESEQSESPVPGAAAEVRKRPPLVREGSFLTRATGSVRQDESRGEWLFLPATLERGGLQREFVLQPSEALADAIRIQQLAPEAIAFEASGEIFIYRGRNYLLPSLLTPIVRVAEVEQEAADVPRSADRPLEGLDEEAIAAELERRLAERITSLPKATTGVAAPGTTAGAPPRRDSTRRTVLPADTVIQSRRGHLVREAATGGWRYVFEGQTAEGGEPSMQVLPCLALERMERLVRESDTPLALVVTGKTTLYEGRNYLLPSVFRVASGGKGINP